MIGFVKRMLATAFDFGDVLFKAVGKSRPKREHAKYADARYAIGALRRLQRWVRANGTAVKAPRHILFNAGMAANQLKSAKSS